MHSTNVFVSAFKREKKYRRNHFDLCDSIHESEYQHIRKPIHPGTKKSIEPKHKFEITLETDECTDEKSALRGTPSKKAWS